MGELSGGVASAETINNGGEDFVLSSGVASGTTIGNGGIEIVFAGGTISDTTVDSGGTLELLGGALVSGTRTCSRAASRVGPAYTVSGIDVRAARRWRSPPAAVPQIPPC